MAQCRETKWRVGAAGRRTSLTSSYETRIGKKRKQPAAGRSTTGQTSRQPAATTLTPLARHLGAGHEQVALITPEILNTGPPLTGAITAVAVFEHELSVTTTFLPAV